MAVGSGKMRPPCDSAEPALSRRPSARHHEPQQQQVQLRQKLRELPARLRSGLTLRRKNPAAGGRVSERSAGPARPCPIYGESSSCAGRALRNIFTVQASDLIKDRVYLTGICRRSCVGSELVDWLLEHCPLVKCRSTAVGVWQLLLDMGIVLSVDRQLYFQDTHVFYQFSADECTYLFCEFERDEGWQNGVKLLLQLVPLTSSRATICNLPGQKIEDTAETNAEILARLTSAVRLSHQIKTCGTVMSWDCGFKYLFALSPTLKAGVLCKLQERDDIGRIELVQKLARENCQFLQVDRKEPEKTEQQNDEVSTIQVKEQDQDVLVLRKVLSHSPAPTSGSAENDWRDTHTQADCRAFSSQMDSVTSKRNKMARYCSI
uniref:DEP domain-containing protein n=1 Tax=Terrapene triunguis TaxID=2587831 RepID=A0A674HX78_9SAUR